MSFDMPVRTAILLSALALAGCAAGESRDLIARPAAPVPQTKVAKHAQRLPPAAKPTRVAIYSIADKTGQRKFSENVALLSTAVTQGAEDILLDVSRKAGGGSWFEVVERAGLRNLLQERKIAELNYKRMHDEDLARDRERMTAELGALETELARSKQVQLTDKEKLKDQEIDFLVAQMKERDDDAGRAAVAAIAELERQEKERQERFDQIQAENLAKLDAMAKGQTVNVQLEQVRAGLTNSQASERERRANVQASVAKARADEDARKQRVAKEISDLKLKKAANDVDAKAASMAIRAEALRRRLNDQLTVLKDRLPHDMPPVKVAKYIIEGAIVGFDSNETTRGIGARFLGIGGDKKYRHDIVTVALRLVDVRNGDVVSSASSTKHVYSILLHGGSYQYVAAGKILEIEAGLSRNEPATLAIRHAVEHALQTIIIEGVERNIWAFADPAAGAIYIDEWRKRFDPPQRIAANE